MHGLKFQKENNLFTLLIKEGFSFTKLLHFGKKRLISEEYNMFVRKRSELNYESKRRKIFK